jgi:hypothetical protein
MINERVHIKKYIFLLVKVILFLMSQGPILWETTQDSGCSNLWPGPDAGKAWMGPDTDPSVQVLQTQLNIAQDPVAHTVPRKWVPAIIEVGNKKNCCGFISAVINYAGVLSREAYM